MKKSKHSLLPKLFALSGLLLFLTSSASAWRFSLPSPSRAESVVVDAAGDIIAAGRAYYGGEVVKLSGTTGELLWQFNASHNQTEQGVNSIALDSHGDVFMLIGTYRGVTKISGVTGKMIWQGNIGGSTAGCQSRFNAIVVDREDNVVAAGTAGCLFNVAKLDGATGVERWHYEREGYGKAVAVDPFGNVAAAGLMNRNFATVKLRGDNGAELWQTEINGAGNFTDVFEEANAVAMDRDGSVVVAGSTSNAIANFRDFTVAKYATNGTVEWIRRLDGNWCEINDHGERVCQANDVANAVALGKDGSIFAAGSMQEDGTSEIRGANEHFHVIKFSSDGDTLWSKPAEEPAFEAEYVRGHAFALSVNAFGNVVAAGVHDGRFTLVKFWGRTGGRAWRRQITSATAGNGNLATGVVMDSASEVVAAGETTEASGFSQFTVVKLRRIDGLDYSADPTPNVPETVLELAPLVYLYPDEKYWPEDPLTFINNSSLNWFHEGECEADPVEARGAVQASKLGAESATPYAESPIFPSNDASCVAISEIKFKSFDYTRPWDGNKRSSAENNFFWDDSFYEREGFYLDQNDSENIRQGIKGIPGSPIYPGAPVFYEYVPGEYVTYWFFYAYNRFETTSVVPDQAHEGDWERISIQLDSEDRPLRVFYYHHEDGKMVDYPNVLRTSDRITVFSAKGSHGSYPIASGPIFGFPTDVPVLGNDHTDYGLEWRTWEYLSDVTKQPWYGYGGAWGEVRNGYPPIVNGKPFTGPLGPSRFKNSLGKWSRISGRVTALDGNGLAGVRIIALDDQGTIVEEVTTCTGNDQTCIVGSYFLNSLVFGRTYTVVPSKQGYSFTPAVLVFRDLREPQTANFSVLDTIPPRLNLPSNITVNADIPQGATVQFTVTATDNATQNPRIACTSASGSLFPIGNTTVACTATDDAGNSVNGTFKILVQGAPDQITDLVTLVKGFNLQKGIENSLVGKLQNALAKLKSGDRVVACNHLGAFINEVQAQSGKKISVAQANQMVTAANRIRAVTGCR